MTDDDAPNEQSSLRQRAFLLFMKYGNLKPKDACTMLHQPKTKMALLRNYKLQWKRNYLFGLGSRVHGKPDSFHRARGWVYVDRLFRDAEKDVVHAIQKGWKQSRNRNHVLIWNDSSGLGRMEWHFKSGRVNIHVRQPPPATKGRVFQLFCNGFSLTGLIDSMAVLDVVLKSIRLKGATAMWDLGVKVPYFVIDLFKLSNGVVIKGGDLSHPTGIEVEFCLPDFVEKAEALISSNTVVMQQLMRLLKGEGTTAEPSKAEPLPDFYSR
jgi:hypothetical protein